MPGLVDVVDAGSSRLSRGGWPARNRRYVWVGIGSAPHMSGPLTVVLGWKTLWGEGLRASNYVVVLLRPTLRLTRVERTTKASSHFPEPSVLSREFVMHDCRSGSATR